MKKGKFSLYILSATLLVGLGGSVLVGCNNKEEEQAIVVSAVEITDADGYEPDTTVMDNSEITLKANVTSNSTDAQARRVTWTSSNNDVASVASGLVTFYTVTENTEVTITATSRSDTTKSDSITFTVKHGVINTYNSRPVGGLDITDYVTDNTISQEDNVQDTAMVYSDVYNTDFYVEAEIRIENTNDEDLYPKFGIMVGTSEYGAWQDGDNNFAMYYVDLNKASYGNWNTLAFVTNNEALNDWSWGSQTENASRFSVTTSVKEKRYFKLGLLREGSDYYLFYGTSEDNYESYRCYKKVSWTGEGSLAPDEVSYAWVGGFKAGVTARNFKSVTDPEELEKLFEEPTSLTLEQTGTQFLEQGQSMKLNVNTSPINVHNLTFTSSNPELFSVTEDGIVTCNSSEIGEKATITVSYGSGEDALSASVQFAVEYADPVFKASTMNGNFDRSHEKDEENPYVTMYDPNNVDHILQFDGEGSTKWFAEMTIEPQLVSNDVDPDGVISTWPKIGLAAMTNGSSDVNSRLIFYTPDDGEFGTTPTQALRLGMERSATGDNWDLPNPEGYEDIDYREPSGVMHLGLARDGADYYFFYNDQLIRKRTLTSAFDASTPSLPGFLSWGYYGAKISNYQYLEGDEADSVLNNIKDRETDSWKLQGQETLTDDKNFVFGHLDTCNNILGLNKMTYKNTIDATNFDISFTISNYRGSKTAWYFPKLGVVLTGTADNGPYSEGIYLASDNEYDRIETNMYGIWVNGAQLGSENNSFKYDASLYDETIEHNVVISIRGGQASVTIDGVAIALENNEGTPVLTRGLKGTGPYTLSIEGEKASAQISNFTVTEL